MAMDDTIVMKHTWMPVAQSRPNSYRIFNKMTTCRQNPREVSMSCMSETLDAKSGKNPQDLCMEKRPEAQNPMNLSMNWMPGDVDARIN